MTEKDIRDRHEALSGMVSTLSTSVQAELRSQAHKDRGELLDLLQEMREKNGVLLSMIPETKKIKKKK